MSEIEPALTESEWHTTADDGTKAPTVERGAGYLRLVGGTLFIGERRAPEIPGKAGKTLHALAALALHGQPHGFTWEDVDALRDAAESW